MITADEFIIATREQGGSDNWATHVGVDLGGLGGIPMTLSGAARAVNALRDELGDVEFRVLFLCADTQTFADVTISALAKADDELEAAERDAALDAMHIRQESRMDLFV